MQRCHEGPTAMLVWTSALSLAAAHVAPIVLGTNAKGVAASAASTSSHLVSLVRCCCIVFENESHTGGVCACHHKQLPNLVQDVPSMRADSCLHLQLLTAADLLAVPCGRHCCTSRLQGCRFQLVIATPVFA